jgi:hypothetical protein
LERAYFNLKRDILFIQDMGTLGTVWNRLFDKSKGGKVLDNFTTSCIVGSGNTFSTA